MARIAFSANWALENAMPRRHLEYSLFLHDHRRYWYVFGAWRPKLSGMRRRTALHCAFRRIGPWNWRMRVAGPNTPALSTVAGQVYPSLVLGDLSRVGYGARLPRIAYTQNRALKPASTLPGQKDTNYRYGHRDRIRPLRAR